jgi:hypothetical protein
MMSRRRFIKGMGLAASGLSAGMHGFRFSAHAAGLDTGTQVLPNTTNPPQPLPLAHFPSRLHAFIWRNWQLVPVARMAQVVARNEAEILSLAHRMGLAKPPQITQDQQRRSYITIIRRNWHLLPYEQLLVLLGWTADELAFTLREDDFLYHKLGQLKPACQPLRFEPVTKAVRQREDEIAYFVGNNFPQGIPGDGSPLFDFVEKLSLPTTGTRRQYATGNQLRFCYSYFALYGDPLLNTDLDPYPEAYLARLASAGVNGVWLQAVLHKLALCPWQPERSAGFKTRLQNLNALIERAGRHGIKVFLYLNEPRTMPNRFFDRFPDLKGIEEGDHATLCTSEPRVQLYLVESIASICQASPELGGFFTITASENLTNCWSHDGGARCPRCRSKSPAEVIAGVNGLVYSGICQAGGKQRLIAWDWGWKDEWAAAAIGYLPSGVSLMSVSEWGLDIDRGGIKSKVGEYSISSVGPGPRSRRHWQLARERGLSVFAKIQAGNTWELSAIPYIPALALVEEHAKNLAAEKVDGLMLGWTLGGYPSPNLETVAEVLAGGELSEVAQRRYGRDLATAVLDAWKICSTAFREFPFHVSVVYNAPFQCGPSNLLWGEATGYRCTMVGFPYDDLEGWRAIYPTKIFIEQLTKVADGFSNASQKLKHALTAKASSSSSPEWQAANSEQQLMEAAALHWQSVAHQSRFIQVRHSLAEINTLATAKPLLAEMEQQLQAESKTARALYQLQARDSRIGFEASNQYYYVPMDLVEKMLNCQDLLERWLPMQRERYRNGDYSK